MGLELTKNLTKMSSLEEKKVPVQWLERLQKLNKKVEKELSEKKDPISVYMLIGYIDSVKQFLKHDEQTKNREDIN